MATPLPSCRVCGQDMPPPSVDLGLLPPVNTLSATRAEALAVPRFPLAVAVCPTCTHAQLTHRLDPKDVFEDYVYFSSVSDTVVRWGKHLAERYRQELQLTAVDLVAELASNDGCILSPFQPQSKVLGVEPARNVAKVANERGVPTLPRFFEKKLGAELAAEYGQARLIIARNVLAHVPDLWGFVQGARDWLADDGIFHVEVPYVRPMLERLEFDTIYHEHLSYFSVTALDRLFRAAGLVLWDVEEIPLHGGSLMVRARKTGGPRPTVARYLLQERAGGVLGPRAWAAFADRITRLREELPAFLDGLRQQGALAAYGAAAKGVILANTCALGPRLPWVADKSPHKQGKFLPGVGTEIVPPDRVTDELPTHLVVLAWNFFAEIRRQLHVYEGEGGRFVLPLPKPHVVATERVLAQLKGAA